VWSCDFNKEGTKLISCSDDKTLKLWEEQDKSKIMTNFYFFKIKIIFFVKDKNNWKVTATISGYHPRTIYSVKWSNLNNLIATGCANNSIHIFKENENNENESKFSMIYHQENAHNQDCNCVDWNPIKQNLLASCSDDGTVKIWSLNE
jgi:cytosolic iron-sulfur protein assembly protein CIAO1